MIVITFLSVCALTLAERDGARVRRILGQAGIIGVSIILFLFLLGQRLSPTAHVGDIFFQMPWIDFLRIVAVSFAVATAEELAFRKYLLEFLFSKYPTIKSAVICIVIFVVLHGWAIVTPLVTSTLFTCLVVRYKSWLAVVAMHCMYDSIFYAERYIKLMKGVAHDVTQTAGMLKIVTFSLLG
ncbi:MAG: CPBP family intramembrane metalloprotease [Rhodocyclaceae bacterium]|nr:CPBP family intramembrane metalloprotease [Rhodocyclaceae bacterium]